MREKSALKPKTVVQQHKKGSIVDNPAFVGGALTLLSTIVSMQASTQYYAFQFNYQPILGANLYGIYPSYNIVLWIYKWYQAYPHQSMVSVYVGMMVLCSCFFLTIFIKNSLSNTSKANLALHGSARWATYRDIERAGLLGHSGVYVGGYRDEHGNLWYLRHDGPEHILTFAPTRSGKGVGLVIPTLLSWPHSVFVTDLKGELWSLTAGWRKTHAKNKVIRFEPSAAEGSARWNPLDEIRLDTEYEVADVQNLSLMIVDPKGKGLESHWDKTAKALLDGVILHCLYKRKLEGTPASLADVDLMLADPNRETRELWLEMLEYKHLGDEPHSMIARSAKDMLDRPDEEAGSVLSTAKSYLELYRDPVIAKNTSASDFKITDLMNHADPVSLYLVANPANKDRIRPLTRIFINMMITLLADKVEYQRSKIKLKWFESLLERFKIKKFITTRIRTKKLYKHSLLGMIDEFPTLGKLEKLQESLAYIAGYGMKMYLICQDINQIKSRETGYGPDEAISSNCQLKNAYPPGRIETAEYLSKLVGTTTAIKEQITNSGKRSSGYLNQVSRTYQESQRPLLTPDECAKMPGPLKKGDLIESPGDMLVVMDGHPPIYGEQLLYFKDPVFIARSSVEAPTITDVTRAA